MRWFLLLITAISFFPKQVFPQEVPFKSGERIDYTVFYSVIGLYVNAGNASFTTTRTTYNNQDVFHVVGKGNTNSKYDWIFKVRDRYESIFHAEDLKPLKFIRDVQEGDYKRQDEVIFDHKKQTAITKKGTYKIPAEVQDVISSLYYARNLDFDQYKKGTKIPFNMFLDDEVFSMYIRYMGKETVKTKYGKFRAIKLKPLLIKGNVFDGGEKMTIWVTDDPNHIPVRIESKLSVGSIKVDLVRYENLKHPLTAVAKN
jgi:hypothetical protein